MKTAIELTASARRQIAEQALTDMDELVLGEWVQKGDLIELSERGNTTVFIVRGRRVRVEAGSQTLILELDHPPRPAAR